MLIIDCRKALDSGIGTYIRELVPRVCRILAGREICLLLSDPSITWGKEVAASLGQSVSIKFIDQHPFTITEQIELRRILRKDDVFWATSISHPLFYNGNLVVTVHDVAQLALPICTYGVFTRLGCFTFLKSIKATANSIIFVSKFSRSEFSRLLGEPQQASAVTYLGVSDRWRDKNEQKTAIHKAPYLLCISSNRPHKNLQTLTKAYLKLMDKIPYDLILIGPDTDKLAYPSDNSLLLGALDNRIHLMGQVDEKILMNYVVNAEALVFPSLYEGFGLPILESMAVGTPVICSDIASLPEVCGDCALYFDPHNDDSLVSSIQKYSEMDHFQRESMRRRGFDRARSFNWDITANQTVDILLKTLS
jgi:glycosyltransferase involved in cell wall biosynthesis